MKTLFFSGKKDENDQKTFSLTQLKLSHLLILGKSVFLKFSYNTLGLGL